MLCAWIRNRSWHIKTAVYTHFNHAWGDFIFNFF